MDTNRIQNMLGKLLHLLKQKEKSVIDIDLMLDYTRVVYADLLEERSALEIAAAKKNSAGVDNKNFEKNSEVQSNNAIEVPDAVSEKQASEKVLAKDAEPAEDAEFQTEKGVEELAAAPAEVPIHEKEEQPPILDTEAHAGIVLEEAIPAIIMHQEVFEDQIEETSAPIEMEDEEAVKFAAKLKPTKADIRKMIGINDRYLFQNELFDNDKFEYEAALDFVNNATDRADVQDYFKTYFVDKGAWELEDDTVQSLYGAVDKYFSEKR